MDLERGDAGTSASIAGILTFRAFHVGSKSEQSGPVVIDAAGKAYRVFASGDNPFEHNLLRAHEGQTIRAQGVWKRGVLVIDMATCVVTESEEETSGGENDGELP